MSSILQSPKASSSNSSTCPIRSIWHGFSKSPLETLIWCKKKIPLFWFSFVAPWTTLSISLLLTLSLLMWVTQSQACSYFLFFMCIHFFSDIIKTSDLKSYLCWVFSNFYFYPYTCSLLNSKFKCLFYISIWISNLNISNTMSKTNTLFSPQTLYFWLLKIHGVILIFSLLHFTDKYWENLSKYI